MTSWDNPAGGTLDLEAVVAVFPITKGFSMWSGPRDSLGGTDTPDSDDTGYEVHIADGSILTLWGGDATSFDTAYTG